MMVSVSRMKVGHEAPWPPMQTKMSGEHHADSHVNLWHTHSTICRCLNLDQKPGRRQVGITSLRASLMASSHGTRPTPEVADVQILVSFPLTGILFMADTLVWNQPSIRNHA